MNDLLVPGKERSFSFDEMLKLGLFWEKVLERQLKINLPDIELIRYESNPEMQRNGIDGIIKSRNLSYDLKTDRHDNVNIYFETISIYEKGIKGWYYTSQADILIYHFLNETLTESKHLFIINLKKLREMNFIELMEDRFELKTVKSVRGDKVWHTQGYAIPVYFLPKDTYFEGLPLRKQLVFDDKFEEKLLGIFDDDIINGKSKIIGNNNIMVI